MLKKVRVAVLGVLMAGVLCYTCIGIIAAPVFAGEACCPGGKKDAAAPCDFTKELGLTAEQQAKIEKLKAEFEKSGQKCSPEECFQKVKEILTKEQGEKLAVLIAKKNGGNVPAAKEEDAPQVK